jgi:hypothetical protein
VQFTYAAFLYAGYLSFADASHAVRALTRKNMEKNWFKTKQLKETMCNNSRTKQNSHKQANLTIISPGHILK